MLFPLALLLFAAEAYSQSQFLFRHNDQNITQAQADLSGCGKECQSLLVEGMLGDEAEFGQMPFDYDFYATSSNFSALHSNAGDLLKLAPINNTFIGSIPAGITLFRMQYVSVDVDGSIVPVTGFIAVPFIQKHDQKYRLMAFAHGTIGHVSSCAPSSSFNLFDYETWTILLTSGYAVVATDYAGLGNNFTTHKYNLPQIQGNDVFFSITAAHQAFPGHFTNEWSAIGHSEGGAAIWGLSENGYLAKDSRGYLGAVAVSPSPRLYDLTLSGLQDVTNPNASSAGGVYAPFIAASIRAAFPTYNNAILSKPMIDRLSLVEELQLCFIATFSLSLDLNIGEVFNLSGKNDSLFQESQERFGAGVGRKATNSLLVIQSNGDQTVNANVTKLAWETGCAAGNNIELSMYPLLDHAETFAGSSPEWLIWLEDRFRGVPPVKGCRMQTNSAFNLAAAYSPTDASFLVL